jgi:hypothetical protein
MSLTSNKAKLTVRSANTSIANFLSYSDDAQIVIAANSCNINSNVSYFGVSSASNEAYIAMNTNNIVSKIAKFNAFSINLQTNTVVQGNVLPSSNLVYDLGNVDDRWRNMYLSGDHIYLNNAVINYDINSNDISFVDNITNDYLPINAKQLKIQDSDDNYSVISTGPTGAILSSFSSNGELISSLNIGQGTTSMLPEGSNLYFTQERANDFIYNSLTLDKLPQGTSNKFIFNNVYNDNLFVTGKLMVTGLEIADLEIILDQQGTCNIGNFHQYIAHVTSNLIFPIVTETSNIIVNEVHDITTQSSNIIVSEVHVLVDNVSNLVNLAQQFTAQLEGFINNELSTTLIEEGVNLYYTPERVGTIVDSSNTQTSNYIYTIQQNLHYTSNQINNRITNLSADMIEDGASHRFIINNNYDDDMFVHGTLSASNLNIIGTTTTINTASYTTENLQIMSAAVDGPALLISQTGDGTNNVLTAEYNDSELMVIKSSGNVGIGVSDPTTKLQVDGTVTASFFAGDGSTLTNVNLNDRTTTLLAEGENLYYTPHRVGVIVSSSNIETSNYVNSKSSELTNTLQNTSNIISTRVTNTDVAMSNYVNSKSSELTNTLQTTSNIISTRVTNTDVAMSNYVNSKSSELTNTLQNTSNIISTRVTNTDVAMSNYVNSKSSELTNTLQTTSNIISTRVTNLSADDISNGSSHMFIINGEYNNDLIVNASLTASNLYIIGTTTSINTTTYQTENIEIISQALDGPALKVIQNGTQNIVEFIDNNTTVFVIKDGGNVGIGTSLPQSNLDIVGSMKLTGSINNTPIAQIAYLNDVTSAIQGQLNAKEATISLGTSEFALVNNTSGKVEVSTITKSELEYLSGAGIHRKFIIDNVYAGDLTVSNMNVIGHVIPSEDVQFDLGSSEHKWRDLFLSGNTIYLNDTRISSDPSTKGLIVKDSNGELTDITASVIKLRNSESSDLTEIRTIGNNIMVKTFTSDNQTSQDFVIKQIDSTDMLKEGSNLFYEAKRVSDIVSASNIKTYNFISDTSNQILQEIKSLNLSPWYDKNTYVEYSNIQVYPDQIKIYNQNGNTSTPYINYNFVEDPTLTFPTTSLINEGSAGHVMSASVYNVNTSIITTTYPYDSITDLICWYKFDNNLADILLDSSANNRTLTNYGNSVSFDNTDYKRGNGSVIFSSINGAYFEIPNTTQFAPDNFTICCWCKIPSSDNVTQCIASFMQDNETNPILLGWDIFIVNNNLQFRTGNTTQISGFLETVYTNFADNTWKHLAITLNKNEGNANIYVNGTHIITIARTYNNNANITTNFYIGRGLYGAYLSNSSRIDDFRMYNRVLTFNEIKNVMGYTLTRQSGRTSDSYSYYWNGLSTNAGDNAYILLPKASVDPIISTNAFTVAAWIKHEILSNESPLFYLSKNQNAFYVDILQTVYNNTTSSQLSFTNGNIISVYNTTWNSVNTVGVWSHYAYTFKYVQNKVYVKLYKDGVLQIPATGGEFTINNFAFQQAENSSFATIAKNATHDISPAYMEDFKLYDEELSETMIRVLAELDTPVPTFKTLVDDVYLNTMFEEKLNNTSNYIDNTNALVMDLNNDLSSYINNTSNILEIKIKNATNQLDNSITSSYLNLSNYVVSVEQHIESMTSDDIIEGITNKFIVDGIYDNDLKVNGTLTTSNLNVIGELTSIETIKYQTENIEIISEAFDGPAVKVIQNGTQDVAQFYNAANPALIVNNDGNVGIGIENPSEKLHVSGNIIVSGSINNITSNELNFLSRTTSNIQAQFTDVYKNQSIAISATSNNIISHIESTAYGLQNSSSNYTDIISSETSNHIVQNVYEIEQNISNYIFDNTGYVLSEKTKGDIYTSNYVDKTRNVIQTQITYIESTTQNSINLNAIYSSNYTSSVNSDLQTQINNKANASHTHVIPDVSGLRQELDSTSNYAKNSFNMLQTQINNKANVSHIHVISDITNLQVLLDEKQSTITGAASTITATNLATSMALVSDTNGKVTNHQSVTSTELGYLDGVTSDIQQQLNSSNTYISSTSNIISNRITNLSANQIANGTINQFIVDGEYNSDLTINATLTVSNLNVVGLTTAINTVNYTTENLQVVSEALDGPALKVVQNGPQNIIELNDTTTNVFVIKKGGNVGIGSYEPQQKLDVVGNIKVSGNVNSVTSTELGHLSGVTSAIQTQLNSKQATIVGAASTITSTNLTTSMALVSDTSGKVTNHATVTGIELGHLSGVTSAIQTQLNNKQATIIGAASSITGTNLATSMALVSNASGKVTSHASVTSTELGYLDGVTSAIQGQLDSKQATIVGAASTITVANLATSMALVSDTNGKVTSHAAVSSTELGYLDGVTSAIQGQLDSKQATIVGAASTITVANLATSMALVSDSNGKVTSHATVTGTELGHLSGVTSAIQTQLNNKQATITGAASSITSTNLTTSMALVSDSNGKVASHATVSGTELGYLDGVTSAIQGQLDSKQATIVGAASTITATNLATSMALVSDASGKVASHASVSSTELGYLDGVTSAIQGQLDSKQATIVGAASSITSTNLATSMALVSDASGKVTSHATVSSTELGYLDGVTSAIQTQFDSKQATIVGAASTITATNLATSMALVSDASGKVASHATVSSTELGYLDGVSSAIQGQLDSKQATITGAASSITATNLATSMALVSDASGKVTNHQSVTSTELGYLDGVTSGIQQQLNSSNTYISSTSNIISNRITNLSANQIANGTINQFIVDGEYNSDLTINATLTVSNLNVVGLTTAINTVNYTTENLQVVSEALDGPALKVVQNGPENIIELNDTTTNVFVVKKGGNVGIGSYEPQQKLDVVGNIKVSGNVNSVTSTELGHLSGVTSAIQTQLNSKQATIVGAASTITATNLATSMALVSDTNGKVTSHATVSSTELGYLDGVTSAIQGQLDSKQATIVGAASTITVANLATSMALVSDTNGKVTSHATVSSTELGYLDGVTSAIQTQLDSKQATIVGAASSITSTNLTTSMALVSNTSGKVTSHATVTGIELGHLSGVTSAIQTQLNNKQATITGAASSITSTNLTTSMALVSNTSGKVTSHATVTGIELGHLSGVTSAIQTQLNNKQATITGAASSITSTNLTTSMALVSNTSGKVTSHATVTGTELGHLSGVTSAIQTQLDSKQATITGAASSITSTNLATSMALVSNTSGKVTSHATVSSTELGYLDGVTSAIQGQLNNKQATITGAASSITSTNLATSMALVSDTSGKVTSHATVTSTELGYLDGVTSAIQGQLDSKQATIVGAASTITVANLATSMALVSDASGKVTSHATVSSTELGYLDGVTSAIQGQLDSKQATIVGAASTITATNLATSMALVSDASGKVASHATVSSTELGYLDGVTSAIQGQLDSKQATIVGAASTITATNLATSMALVSDASGKVASHATVSSTELGYLDGVSSAIQGQLDSKQATITGAASSITATNLATSMALVSDASGKVTNHQSVTSTELGYLDGVTSGIQQQLNSSNTYISSTSNIISNRITNLSANQIANGTINQFIVDGEYNSDLTINATLTVSNLNVVGLTTAINTVNYTTENLQVVSEALDGPALKVVQNGPENIIELNDTTTNVFVVKKGGNVGIGSYEPQQKLDVVGNIKVSGNVNSVTSTELGHLSGVTSAIQTQLNNKQATIVGAASTITATNLATSMALVSDSNGKVVASSISTTLLNYLSDVSGNIGSALASKENNLTFRNGLNLSLETVGGVNFRYVDTVWTQTSTNIWNNNTGNVGIGTNAPSASYKLDVNGALRVLNIVSTNLNTNTVVVSDANKQLVSSAVTSTQLGYLSDVTSAIQGQLNTKEATITLTANRALVSDTSGKVSNHASVTSTQLGYLSDVTSAIQAQLNTKEATISTLPVSKGGTGKGTITASRLLGCTTANQVDEIQLGTNLSFTGNTLNATGGGSAQWTDGTNLIYYNAGTVGIGKTNPNTSYKLDITGGVFVSGSILATGNITASYSDMRLKDIVERIENPIEKVMKINTFKYKPSALAQSLNIHDNVQVGVSAQDVKAVLPEVVSLAAFDTSNLPSGEVVSKSGSEYLTVSYERLVPLLIECIKELNSKIEVLTQKIQ